MREGGVEGEGREVREGGRRVTVSYKLSQTGLVFILQKILTAVFFIFTDFKIYVYMLPLLTPLCPCLHLTYIRTYIFVGV